MKFIGREIPITRVFSAGFIFFRLLPRLSIVKHPLTILKYYIQRNSPENIELKGDKKISFSTHPHDIMTFFGIFLKKDYGDIKPDSIVIDIGANIGVFSLYAALSGAKKVYSFEPSKEAFQILCKNIELNNLKDVIIPFNKAVSSVDDLTIKFPVSSSPYNKIDNKIDDDEDYLEVKTISLKSICDENNIQTIGLLKLDCEGAEFDILPNIDELSLAKIEEVKMEYHVDPKELIIFLEKKGYKISVRKERSILFAKKIA
ncbi:MAG TPA: hypothetical protein DIT07_12420 [Sphingobacteriaceae bacterium]|nr:hypothetical protein [Sphingobacteriaceae bacterium]